MLELPESNNNLNKELIEFSNNSRIKTVVRNSAEMSSNSQEMKLSIKLFLF